MLLGHRPHTDFHYNFGPSMLDAAILLFRLGSGAISIDTAYCPNLMATWTIGAFLPYYVVNHLGGEFKKTSVPVHLLALLQSDDDGVSVHAGPLPAAAGVSTCRPPVGVL